MAIKPDDLRESTTRYKNLAKDTNVAARTAARIKELDILILDEYRIYEKTPNFDVRAGFVVEVAFKPSDNKDMREAIVKIYSKTWRFVESELLQLDHHGTKCYFLRLTCREQV